MCLSWRAVAWHGTINICLDMDMCLWAVAWHGSINICVEMDKALCVSLSPCLFVYLSVSLFVSRVCLSLCLPVSLFLCLSLVSLSPSPNLSLQPPILLPSTPLLLTSRLCHPFCLLHIVGVGGVCRGEGVPDRFKDALKQLHSCER